MKYRWDIILLYLIYQSLKLVNTFVQFDIFIFEMWNTFIKLTDLRLVNINRLMWNKVYVDVSWLTSFNDGSWSLFFHLSNILIFVDYYTLAMTKMKCSILGRIYTGTDVCVGSKKKGKNWADECKRNSLSLSPSLLLFHLCLNVNRLDSVYTSAYSSMNKREKKEERNKERNEKERTNKRFRLQLVLCIEGGLYDYMHLLIHIEGSVYIQSRLGSYTSIVEILYIRTSVKTRITTFETFWDWPTLITYSLESYRDIQ